MSYLVYILANERGDSYPGCTNNLARRLRQHNGELRGGAAVTTASAKAGYLWHVHATFIGFHDKCSALKFEACIRHQSRDSADHAVELAKNLCRSKRYTGIKCVE